MLINDKQLTISAAGSRKAISWPAQTMYWSEMVERLRTPVRGMETLSEYLQLPKSKQDDLKDVGGFVAGTLQGNRRKASNVTGRDVIALDLDNIPPGGTQDALRRLEGLGCAYVAYSTRKHEKVRPRLRVLAPLDRTATADEYEPLARKLAAIIGIELCDPTTFEASRLMYWPSCSADSQYVYQYGDKPFLSADGVLAMYQDWRNIAEWPEVPGAQQKQTKLAEKQADPTTKAGIVGAFCKTYDIYQVMDAFLAGVYEPCDAIPGRYTFTGGSTVGGAVVYDNGQFLFSHHATDPAGGKLVNAFDLVRLHLFSDRDDDIKEGTPTNKLPSYTAMCKLAVSDGQVTALLNQERYEKATQEFGTPPDGNANWISKLQVSATTGTPLKTINNVCIMLEYDPNLAGRIKMNLFSGLIIGTAPLPWKTNEIGDFNWTDNDGKALRRYAERVLGFHSKDIVDVALSTHAVAHGFNPLKEYLISLEWDGIPRLDTLYIDYLGAEDCPFVRTITRKAFAAAVARVMTDNVKFDWMTVICGPQRIGKSTLFRKLGKHWFTDSIKTFEGKEAEEIIEGKWIVEIAELQALNKTDINRVKQFLSKVDDQYRAAYGHNVKTQIRRCVFFGTTNNQEYLRDPSGNRRFWPVNAQVKKPIKSVFYGLDSEVDQIWAEAVMLWRLAEPLYLTDEMEEEAEKRREMHLERDPLQGQIEDFLDRAIPDDWSKWSIDRRYMFWANGITDATKLVPRDRTCAMEIWKECLRESRTLPKIEAHRINTVLEALPGWERAGLQRFGAAYGHQKGFKRTKKEVEIVNQSVNQVENLLTKSKIGPVNQVEDG